VTSQNPSGSTLPEIVEIVEIAPDEAARAAGVLAGFAVGLGRELELRTALEYIGLTGIPPRKADRKALTAKLDQEIQQRFRRDAA
jgi:hypothetical protein